MAKRKNGAADEFDQGGPDGPSKQRGKGDNSVKRYDGDDLRECLETIAAAEAQIRKNNEANKAKNQPHREKIADAKRALVEADYPASVLGAIIRKHKLLDQAERIDEHFDDDAKEEFASMEEALGQYSDTELGKWAIRARDERAGAH